MTLKRAQGRSGAKTGTTARPSSSTGPSLPWDGQGSSQPAGDEEAIFEDAVDEPEHSTQHDERAVDSGTYEQHSTQDGWASDDPWRQWYGRQWQRSWNWQDTSARWDWSTTNDQSQVESAPHSGIQLLPDFVQGWFLLQDSGLDTNEKNMIIAALKRKLQP